MHKLLFFFVFIANSEFAKCPSHENIRSRSQDNAEISLPRVASAVITVDFGFVGAHNVTVNQKPCE